MPSFPILRPHPVPATHPTPAPRISLRRDPPAAAPPPETPPTSPEPIDDRADLSQDEEIDEPDDTDNSLIIVNSPTPPILVVSDDVPDVVSGDVLFHTYFNFSFHYLYTSDRFNSDYFAA